MSSKKQATGVSKFDEKSLRAELKALRAQIPTSRRSTRLSASHSIFRGGSRAARSASMTSRQLATRLMDSACVHRAVLLKDQIGFESEDATHKEFSDFIKGFARDKDADAFEAFKRRFARARNGIVFTAHPTFGLSEALSDRMAEIAVSGDGNGQTIGLPHRPDAPLTLEYEHGRVQSAIRNLRDAYCDILGDFFRTAHKTFGDKALTANPQLATFASWVGYDLDGRTDIKWTFSFIVRLKEKIAALADIRERVQALRPQLGEDAEMVRLVRQITGKLDLSVAAAEGQLKALETVGKDGFTLAQAANVITQGDGHNITSAEPILALLEQITDATDNLDNKIAVQSVAGLLRATGLGMSHIHVRVNAVQINNAFRAFVHESWTRDLTERQALARIVEMIRTVKPETVNFETLDLENATAIRQFALAAQICEAHR